MVSAPKYLADTNVLLRISGHKDYQNQTVVAALQALARQNVEICYSMQNIAEFWNVCTRPFERNGFGIILAETIQRVEYIERTMTFLPDNERVYSNWRQLVVNHNVRGVQVHDARLVAVMQAYGLNHILTMNQDDFARYSDIRAIHPAEVQSLPR